MEASYARGFDASRDFVLERGELSALLTRANLRVNSPERSCTGGTLHLLTTATSGLTSKREGERVLGSESAPWSRASGSLVNRSRGRRERGPGAGTTGVVSRRTRAPTALATGAPQGRDPKDSGPMMPGSPGRTRTGNLPVNSGVPGLPQAGGDLGGWERSDGHPHSASSSRSAASRVVWAAWQPPWAGPPPWRYSPPSWTKRMNPSRSMRKLTEVKAWNVAPTP